MFVGVASFLNRLVIEWNPEAENSKKPYACLSGFLAK